MLFELLCFFFCGLWSLSLSCCVLPFVMRSFCVDALFCVPVSRIFLLQVLPLWLQACWGVCIVVHRVLQLLVVQVHLGVCIPVRHVLLLLWVQVHLSVCVPGRHVLLLWVQVHLCLYSCMPCSTSLSAGPPVSVFLDAMFYFSECRSTCVCIPVCHVLLLWVQVHLCLYSWTPCSTSLSAGPPVSVFLYAMFYFSECRSTCVCIPVRHVLLLWVQVHLCLYSCTPCSTSLSAGPPVSVFLYAMFYFSECRSTCVCIPVRHVLLLWVQVHLCLYSCTPCSTSLSAGPPVSVFLYAMFYFSECRSTCVCIPVCHVLLLLCLCSCTPCSNFASVVAGWQEHLCSWLTGAFVFRVCTPCCPTSGFASAVVFLYTKLCFCGCRLTGALRSCTPCSAT